VSGPEQALEPAKPKELPEAKTSDSARSIDTQARRPETNVTEPGARTSSARSRERSRSTRRTAQAAPTAAKAVSGPKGGRTFWVQVGAFRDPAHARALVAKLRESNFGAEEVAPSSEATRGAGPRGSDVSPPGSPVDKYDVFVAGASPSEIQTKLTAKGLAADPVAGGAVVTPSLPLRDAVTLSKDLAGEGLKVQVRRATGAPAGEAAPGTNGGQEPMAHETGDGLYRVRVGSFPDRASADAARRALAASGYTGFVTQSGR
jgi:cell division septation protein DedD